MESKTHPMLEDPLSKRFKRISDWLISNELHLDDYDHLLCITVVLHRELSIQITHACAKRIHLVPDPLIEHAEEMGIEHIRECTQDGIKIVWVIRT